ncbi:hypothetical protein [Motiliproteus sp. SC1-56]|uniref:hypothetical protein n=1 Tax=Motiliproteus sp. SC1-56 TaxID=2799565 RepID=UPI001A8F5A66|nr:hypothetical protein [Motiliproteus sp. SC1-56]
MNDFQDDGHRLEQLHEDLARKLNAQLEAIDVDYQQQARELREKLEKRARQRQHAQRQAHENRLRQRQRHVAREISQREQKRLWDFQQHCVDEIIQAARQRLGEQAPPADYLQRWLPAATPRLSAGGEKRLRLSPSWHQALASPGLAVAVAPLLGGAVLEDPRHHLAIDGSWEQRLETLTPALWQRWLDDVGAHDPD